MKQRTDKTVPPSSEEVLSKAIEPIEANFINHGITSIQKLKQQYEGVIQPHRCSSLNLHCNAISRISDLTDFLVLQHLDLSSNNIRRIEGLTVLTQLKVLNLASNRITHIEGLESLHQLRKLVLAHNRIKSLQGLVQLHGPQFSLEVLDLRGNRIGSTRELHYFGGCVNLRELSMQDRNGMFANPVCKRDPASYYETVMSYGQRIEILDGEVVRNSEGVRESTGYYYPSLAKYEKYLKEMSDDDDDDKLESEDDGVPHDGRDGDIYSEMERIEQHKKRQTILQDVYPETHSPNQHNPDWEASGVRQRNIAPSVHIEALRSYNSTKQYQADLSSAAAEMIVPTPTIDRALEIRRRRAQFSRPPTYQQQQQLPAHHILDAAQYLLPPLATNPEFISKPRERTCATQTETPIEVRDVGTDTVSLDGDTEKRFDEDDRPKQDEESSAQEMVLQSPDSSMDESDMSSTMSNHDSVESYDDSDGYMSDESESSTPRQSSTRNRHETKNRNIDTSRKPIRKEHCRRQNWMQGKTVIDTNTLNKLHADLGAAKAYIQQREQDLADMLNRWQMAEKTILQMKQIVSDRERKHKSVESRMKHLQKEHENCKDKHNSLNQTISELKLVNENLIQQNKRLQSQNEEAVEQVNALREELIKSNSQLESLQTQPRSKDFSQKYFEILKELNALKLNTEKQEEQAELRENRKRLEYEQKIQELTIRHQQELGQRQLQYQESEMRFQRELRRLEEMVEKEEKDKEAARAALDEATKTIVNLKNQVKTVVRKELNTAAVNAELAESMKKYKKLLDEAQRRRHEATMKLQKATRDHEHQLVQQKRLLEEIPTLRREKSVIEDELKRRNEQLEAAEKKINDLESLLGEKKHGQKEEVKQLQEECEKLKAKITEYEQNNKVLKTCNDDLGELIRKVRVELEEAKKNNTELQSENKKLESVIESTVEELSGKIERREDRIDDLNEEIHRLRQEHDMILRRRRMHDEKFQREKEELLERIEKLEDRLEARKRKYKDKIQALQNLLDREKAERTDMARRLTDHLSNHEQLKNEMEEMSAMMREKEGHMRQLKQALSNKSAEVGELVKVIARMKQETAREQEQKTKAEETLKQMEALLRLRG